MWDITLCFSADYFIVFVRNEQFRGFDASFWQRLKMHDFGKCNVL